MDTLAVVDRDEVSAFELLVPFDLQKLNDEQQIVEGYVSKPGPDSQNGEDIDAGAWTPEVLKEYMEFPTLRVQHDTAQVAGKLLKIEARKDGLWCQAHVVDPVDWAKVKAGVFKAFSFKGNVAKRDPKNRKHILLMKSLTEVSLVDRPANRDALIEVIKMADSKVSHFDAKADEIEKGMYQLGQLGQIVATLKSMYLDQELEERNEGDEESTLPDGLAQALNLLGELLQEMAEEETEELLEGVMATEAQKAAILKLADQIKAGKDVEIDVVEKGAKVSKGVFNAALKDSVEEHKQAIAAHKEAIADHADIKDEAEKLEDGEDHAPLMKKMQECSKAAFKGTSSEKVEKLADIVSELRKKQDAALVKSADKKSDATLEILSALAARLDSQNEVIQKLADKTVSAPRGRVLAVDKGDEVTAAAKKGGDSKEDVIAKMKDAKLSNVDKIKALMKSPHFVKHTQVLGF